MSKSLKYLVLNVKGLDFVETWFGAPKRVPPDLTKLYQLILNMVTMKGMMLTYLALRAGYTLRLIKEAVKRDISS